MLGTNRSVRVAWLMGITFAAIVDTKKGGDGFGADDEYDRFRCCHIHRMHLVGYAGSSVIILIGMLVFL